MADSTQRGIAATLLTRPFDRTTPRPLDPRIGQEPRSLTGGAEGRLFFDDDGFEWRPARFHPRFRAIRVPWSDVTRVQIAAPLDVFAKSAWALSRESNGYIRVFCTDGLIELSFVLIDGQEIYDGFVTAMGESRVRVLEPGDFMDG